MTPDPALLRRLADVLAYPGPGLADRAAECAERLVPEHPAAALRLACFAAFAETAGDAALEEAYTAAFDLAPIGSPYVGDQLFGACRERSFLLSGLRELRRQAGLPDGVELPDHVVEVLRLAAAPIPSDVQGDLLRDGLVPALGKLLAALEAAGHPWADAVASALEVATRCAPPPPATARPVAEVTP